MQKRTLAAHCCDMVNLNQSIVIVIHVDYSDVSACSLNTKFVLSQRMYDLLLVRLQIYLFCMLTISTNAKDCFVSFYRKWVHN